MARGRSRASVRGELRLRAPRRRPRAPTLARRSPPNSVRVHEISALGPSPPSPGQSFGRSVSQRLPADGAGSRTSRTSAPGVAVATDVGANQRPRIAASPSGVTGLLR